MAKVTQHSSKSQPKSKTPRVEIRCIDCDCSEPGKEGKLLGVLLGVNQMMLNLLRSQGIALELPCKTHRSKRRTIPL